MPPAGKLGREEQKTYLSIISRTGGKQSMQGIVSRNQEAREVDKEFTGDVKEH